MPNSNTRNFMPYFKKLQQAYVGKTKKDQPKTRRQGLWDDLIKLFTPENLDASASIGVELKNQQESALKNLISELTKDDQTPAQKARLADEVLYPILRALAERSQNTQCAFNAASLDNQVLTIRFENYKRKLLEAQILALLAESFRNVIAQQIKNEQGQSKRNGFLNKPAVQNFADKMSHLSRVAGDQALYKDWGRIGYLLITGVVTAFELFETALGNDVPSNQNQQSPTAQHLGKNRFRNI